MRMRSVSLGLVLAPLLLGGTALGANGVIEINQARALAGGVTSADGQGFPVTLVAGASYELTSDLVVTSDQAHVIEDAPPPAGAGQGTIHLDLKGFSIRCSSGCVGGGGIGNGIFFDDVSDVTITNGSVSRMRNFGIEVRTQGARIDRIHSFSNGNTGIACNATCMVTNSTARSNGTGIVVRDRSSVLSCISEDNGSHGISVGPHSNVRDSTVTENGGLGLVMSNLTPAVFGYGGNVFVNNGGTVTPTGVETGGNLCQGDAICP